VPIYDVNRSQMTFPKLLDVASLVLHVVVEFRVSAVKSRITASGTKCDLSSVDVDQIRAPRDTTTMCAISTHIDGARIVRPPTEHGEGIVGASSFVLQPQMKTSQREL
jgi:hypothetical protein